MTMLDGILSADTTSLMLIVSRPDEIPEKVTHVLCLDRCRVVGRVRKPPLLSSRFAGSCFRKNSMMYRVWMKTPCTPVIPAGTGL